MPNSLTVNQVSTILNSVHKQATGADILGAIDSSTYVSVGAKLLLQGYDTTLGQISQVLAETIFSIRPYSAKFKGLMVTEQQYGNRSRKITVADKDFVDNEAYQLVDGESIDQFAVNKPNVLELNFYGQNTFNAPPITIFKHQLDQAFKNGQEFASFVTMLMTNISDLLEQARENLARSTVANFIAGKVKADNGVIHLLTEYNAETGAGLTNVTVKLPENYSDFMQWVSSRIKTATDFMTERTQKYHINVVGQETSRHTPYEDMKVYILSKNKREFESRVLADAFNDKYVKLADSELVNFWQSIDSPDTINVKATYLDTDGSLITMAEAEEVTDVFGVIFDKEALGITTVNQEQANSPYNARGKYTNMYWSETGKYWIDYTENGIVLLMD